MKNKIAYLFIIAIILIIGILITKKFIIKKHTLIDMNNTENAEITYNKKENISEKLSQEKSFNGLTIKDIKLIAENGKSTLTATVENNSEKDYEGGKITIAFINSEGSEYDSLESVLPKIKKGTSNKLNASTTNDLINAYDFTIK